MIENVSVVGAGTMGNGIAQVFAQSGYHVTMTDTNPAQLDKAIATISRNVDRLLAKGIIPANDKLAIMGRIATLTDLHEGVKQADLVVEAASEDTELKLSLFRQLDAFATRAAVLATNTSSISITKIAAATKRPASVIGMHFMNPVPVMKLVEVINGYETSRETTELILEVSRRLGKQPCVVNDYPGFIANRILMPMINEAVFSVYEGVAGIEQVDTIMKTGMAHPMGPLQLADFIGLDVCLSILRVLYEGLGNPRYAPCPLLVNMVSAGKLGIKSGEGFYIYAGQGKELVPSARFR